MRILLLGKNGQLGFELHRELLPLGEVIALDAPELDFADQDLLRKQVTAARPDVIINAVAYTAVDQAEKQPDLVMAVNADAPALLAETAKETGAALIHYSTDYVFDGKKRTPYTEADSPNPISVYAASKAAGDAAIQSAGDAYLIFRSAWIYSSHRDNFVKKVLSWAHTRTEVSVVTDQVGCPTWARELAGATALVLAMGHRDISSWIRERRGLYNLASSGYASRYVWAQEILKHDPMLETQTVRVLKPAKTVDFPTPAQRPLFTALDCSRFESVFGFCLSDWRTALSLAIQEIRYA